MPGFSYDCPHEGCGTARAHFSPMEGFGAGPAGATHVAACCNVCRGLVVFEVKTKTGYDVALEHFDGSAFKTHVQVVRTYPAAPAPSSVEALPDGVRGAFEEAEAARIARLWSSAAVMYRKTIERAVKDRFPEATGPLRSRIAAAERSWAVPRQLVELLTEVRFLGNDGAHDDDDLPAEDVIAGGELTRLFLIYAYELPAKLEAARARRDRAGSTP